MSGPTRSAFQSECDGIHLGSQLLKWEAEGPQREWNLGYRVNSEPLWMGNLVKCHLKIEVNRLDKTWLTNTAPESNTRTAKERNRHLPPKDMHTS